MEMQTETPLRLKRADGTEENVTEEGIRERVRAGALVFETMGREGDVKTIWDPSKPAEVDAARAQFDALKTAGYRAYRTDEKGVQGEPMKEFDPSAARVVFVPAMAGG